MKKVLIISLSIFILFYSVTAFSDTKLQDVMGIMEDNSYKNSFLGFGCSLGDWTMASQERIEAAGELTKKLFSSDVHEAIEQLGTLTVFIALAPNGIDNISANLTYLGDQAQTLELLGIEFLYENQLDQLKLTLEAAQMQDVLLDVSSVVIDGRALPCLRMQYNYMGILNINAIQVSLLKDNYLVNITSTASDMKTAEDAICHVFWM